MGFMFDTCIINLIVDGLLDNEWSLRGQIFVTDIQFQEILDTPNAGRRTLLLSGLLSLHPTVIRPEIGLVPADDNTFDTGERLPMNLSWLEHAAD